MRRLAYFGVLVTLVLVPFIGVVHGIYMLIWNNDDGTKTADENNVVAWLAFYPMVCGLSIVKYFFMHQQELFYHINKSVSDSKERRDRLRDPEYIINIRDYKLADEDDDKSHLLRAFTCGCGRKVEDENKVDNEHQDKEGEANDEQSEFKDRICTSAAIFASKTSKRFCCGNDY